MKRFAMLLTGAMVATAASAQTAESFAASTSVLTNVLVVSAPLVLLTTIAVAAGESNGTSATAQGGPTATAP